MLARQDKSCSQPPNKTWTLLGLFNSHGALEWLAGYLGRVGQRVFRLLMLSLAHASSLTLWFSILSDYIRNLQCNTECNVHSVHSVRVLAFSSTSHVVLEVE